MGDFLNIYYGIYSQKCAQMTSSVFYIREEKFEGGIFEALIFFSFVSASCLASAEALSRLELHR